MSALGRRSWVFLTLATLLVLAAIRFDALPLLRGPAPYPPEWQWEYRPAAEGGSWLPCLATGGGLLALLALSASPWARRRPTRTAAAILGTGLLLGWGHQLALLTLEPDGALHTLLERTLSRTITSYHTAALSAEARDPIEFLRRHADLLPGFRTSAKHAATHPPGPVLFYRGLIALCEASPGLTRRTLAALGESPDRPLRPPQTPATRAAALLGALLLGLVGASTAVPVSALARRVTGDALAAARVGVVWGLVPGPALMTPQFDQALALPVAASAALLASALTRDRPGGRALLAGVCGALAFSTSYGAAAFLAIGSAAALSITLGHGAPVSRLPMVVGLASAGPAAGLAFSMLVGHEPLRSALTALALHREVYTRPRSYALWLAFNPLDLAVFLGVPVAVLLAIRAGRSWSLTIRHDPGPGAGDRLRVVVTAGLALLLLSGVTRGEVGRLWIPIMPFLLVAALEEPRSAEGGPTIGWAHALLVGALLLPLDLAIRVHWRL